MTRVKISICILFFVISASIFSSVWVNIKCSRLIDISQEVGTLSSAGDTSAAISAAQELSIRWEDFRTAAGTLVKSEKLSEIDRICSRIIPMLENSSDELSADLTELEVLLRNLKRGETPTLTGIC